MRTDRRDHHADDHADGGQRGRRRQHLADVAEPGGETAFDQDHGQRRGAQVPGHFHVVEPQPEPVLADRHTDQQEQQHAGEPDAGRHARTHDAGQQHEATDQHSQIQLLQAHFGPVHMFCPAKAATGA